MDNVTIGIFTWPNKRERLEYLERCIRRLRTYLTEPQPKRWICSAEVQDVDGLARHEVDRICNAYCVKLKWHVGRASIGGNINNLLKDLPNSHYLFLSEDDRLLHCDLNLADGTTVLQEHQRYELINYSYGKQGCLKGSRLTDDFFETTPESPWHILNFQQLFRPGFFTEYGPYVEEPDSPDAAEREMNLRLKVKSVPTLFLKQHVFTNCGKVSAIERQ